MLDYLILKIVILALGSYFCRDRFEVDLASGRVSIAFCLPALVNSQLANMSLGLRFEFTTPVLWCLVKAVF